MKVAALGRLRLKAILLQTVAQSPLQAPLVAPIGSIAYESRRPWLRRGAGNTDWIQLLIQGAKYFNIVDFGAIGDGVTDNRAAINAAKVAALAVGGGVVFIPPGDFAVERNGVTASIEMTGGPQNLVFLGCGRSSRVLMSGSAGGGGAGWYLFNIINSATNVAFKNMCLDGSAMTNIGIGQDHHLIRVAGLTSDAGAVSTIDCYWNKVDGDGIRLLTSALGQRTIGIQVVRGAFQMDVNGGGTGSRAAITVQRDCADIGIHSCLFEGSTDQVLDMETSGAGTTENIVVERTHLIHSAAGSRTIVGCNGSATVLFRRLLFADCVFDGGQVAFHEMSEVLITYCMQTVSRFADTAGSFEFDGVQHSLVYGCQLYREDTNDAVGYSIQFIEGEQGSHSNTIAGSICENASAPPVGGQDGILVQNTPNVTLHDNMIYVTGADLNTGSIVRFRSLAVNAANGVCRRSLLIGQSVVLGSAFQVSSSTAGRTTPGCIASGNVMRGILSGIGMSAVASSTVADTFGGDNVAVTTSQMISTSGPPVPTGVCVAANAGALPIGVWEFSADPNTRIAAVIGAIGCNRLGAAGTVLYVKEADSGLTSGWDAK